MRETSASVAVALGMALGVAAVGWHGWRGEAVAAPPGERLRARPPETWPPLVRGTFFDDAFATLDGPRPDFAALAGKASGAAPADPPAPGDATGDGFRWSALVSAETLVDEVKDLKGVLQEALVSTTTFKGGGYEKARVAYSSLALAYGVIAAYDGDVRWKKDAPAARDLFARAGFNCKVGTDQSFAEAKLRLTDLGVLLEGNALTSRSDRDPDGGDPPWSQVAARPALMSRLEQVDAAAAAAIASRTDFNRQLDRFLHEVELAAVIAEVIQRKEFEYHDDDTYRGYAAAMRAAAEAARAAAGRDDYDAARTAVGNLKKSCDTCHGDYRS